MIEDSTITHKIWARKLEISTLPVSIYPTSKLFTSRDTHERPLTMPEWKLSQSNHQTIFHAEMDELRFPLSTNHDRDSKLIKRQKARFLPTNGTTKFAQVDKCFPQDSNTHRLTWFTTYYYIRVSRLRRQFYPLCCNSKTWTTVHRRILWKLNAAQAERQKQRTSLQN